MRAFVRHDLDGFFGLFIDNLVQLLLIVVLMEGLCGMTGAHAEILYGRILPGAAASILIGNLFYAVQAHGLARRERRTDVTALPYGINTPSLLVYVYFVMAPIYAQTKDPELAWRMGLLSCFGSGMIELLGAFVAERIRKRTPRAALLSTLAGIAIGFISMTFALQIWARPLVAMAPLAIVLLTYFGGVRFSFGLPGGLVAVVVGTFIAWGGWVFGRLAPDSATVATDWIGVAMDPAAVQKAWSMRALSLPQWSGHVLWSVLQQPGEWMGYLSVIIPMGLFTLIGSMQNIESAEAAGDRYDTFSSLAVNGIGTLVASSFGSCFPTTLYIGHPGWKELGARAGYSTLNGLVVTALCLTGTVALVGRIVPIEAGVAIVLWIGIVITAQAFQATAPRHAPAVAVGLFPAIAAWGATVMSGVFFVAGGTTIQQALEKSRSVEVNGFLVHGLILLERGYIFTCMILAAAAACIVDRKFKAAGVWSIIGAVTTALGLMHSYQVSGNTIDYYLLGQSPRPDAMGFHAHPIAIGYLIMALLFFLAARRPSTDPATALGHHY